MQLYTMDDIRRMFGQEQTIKDDTALFDDVCM